MNPEVQSEIDAAPRAPIARTPLWMAPLRGITDCIYRTAYAEHFAGIDLAVAPFVTTHTGRRIKPAHVRDLEPRENRRLPVIPQILTKNAADCITLADHFCDMGYATVNLNCGCPFPQVANKGRGSGLLCTPDDLDRLLDTVFSKVSIRLSIKTRLGRRRADEIRAVLTVFNRYPLASLIVHPRTGLQMYEGEPDLDMFAWCLEHSRHPVVYNGDITHLEFFRGLADRFDGVAGWMIGRGLLADPFLPDLIKTGRRVDNAEKTDRFRQFHDTLFERYRRRLSGPGHLLDRMKGLWRYFAQGFRDSEAARKRILKARSITQYREALAALWAAEPRWLR
jgi:tRNA-dihydrouridine synthase